MTKFIVDQRIIIEAESYQKVGHVLDKIAEAVEKASPTEKVTVKADFVNFQTRPCKAMALERELYDQPMQEIPQPINQGAQY